MITKKKMHWSFIKFSQPILEEVYGDKCGEFVLKVSQHKSI